MLSEPDAMEIIEGRLKDLKDMRKEILEFRRQYASSELMLKVQAFKNKVLKASKSTVNTKVSYEAIVQGSKSQDLHMRAISNTQNIEDRSKVVFDPSTTCATAKLKYLETSMSTEKFSESKTKATKETGLASFYSINRSSKEYDALPS